jgi:hypothetical protein
VPTSQERYQQRVAKLKQRFPERPIHHRIDHNPSACQPGCFYHEEDQTKHDHREVQDRAGRWYRRGILRDPAAAKPAPPRPRSDSNSGAAILVAPRLSPDWQREATDPAMQAIIDRHMLELKAFVQEEKEPAVHLQPPVPDSPGLPQPVRAPSLRVLRRQLAQAQTPPPQAGKRPPTTPDSPQEAPKKHHLEANDEQGVVHPVPSVVVVVPMNSSRLPLPEMLATGTPTVGPLSAAQSSPIHV